MKDKKKIAGSIIKTQTKVLAYVVICLVIVVMGSSYALFFQVKHNTTNQVIQAGSLTISAKAGTKLTFEQNQQCFEPMTDAEATAAATCIYTLSVTNPSTSLPSTFKLKVTKDTTNTIELSKLKVKVKKNGTDLAGAATTLSDTGDNILFTEKIASGGTASYSIQVYPDSAKIDEDKDDGKILNLKLEGIGEVDVSSANLK